MKRTRIAVSLSLFMLTAAVSAQTTRHLATLGRVWGVVKHAHPYIGSLNIPWDRAGVRAIERTMQVTDAETLADVTQEMLGVLGDPATLVERDCVESGTPADRTPVVTAGGALYVPPGAAVDAETIRSHANVIFDLRPRPGRCTSANAAQLETLAPLLFNGTIPAVLQRTVMHHGYKSQDPADASTTLYSTGFLTPARPAFTGTGTGERTTTFVVDVQSSMLPAVAQAMVRSGRASILSVGRYRDLAMSWQELPLEGGYHARIRTSEALTPVQVRTTLPADATEADIVAAAIEPPALGRRRAVRGPATTVVRANWRYDDPYTDMKYPDPGYRVLAAYRYWNAIKFFYPYKELIDPWDEQFAPMIDLMIAPRDRTEYELALAAMTRFVPDGHSYAFNEAHSNLLGLAGPPFRTMPVEGQVVVTAFTNKAVAAAAGIQLGDALLAIDGRPIEERLEELRRYNSASTESSLAYIAALWAPRGPDGTEPLMRFRRPDGSEYEVKVPRSSAWQLPVPEKHWKMLPNNIGYVDLVYLTTGEMDAMFSDLGHAKAIIFDMRGYPRGVFVELARRMNITGSAGVAQIRIPHVVEGAVSETFEIQALGRNPPSFRGKTIMLIDERAISQSEHTGLVLEAVANATFIGSNSAGANGNVTRAVMPGGTYISFTGMDVRHLDGRQLQRIGLVPHVPVPRTVAGVAAGRDEVLEKAIEVARQ